MAQDLSHARVVITGGFGALGRAVAQAAIAAGARVCLIGHGPVAQATADTTTHPPLPLEAPLLGGVDLTRPDAADNALAQAAQTLGGVDVLVNVAGGFQWQTLSDACWDAWDRMYAMNLQTTVLATRAALPHLRRSPRARIVNVAAMAALSAGAGMGAYAASKAGVLRFTEALAAELADAGINVNAILPSVIDTPHNRRDMPDADRRHWVRAADVARAVLLLLSDDALAITGAALPVTLGRRVPQPSDT